jgi:nucleoside-diphosphate-sugar epimerase
VEKAARLLDYRPEIDFMTGLKKLVEQFEG